MENISLCVPDVPYEYDSLEKLRNLFHWHQLGKVKCVASTINPHCSTNQRRFYRAKIHFVYWYDTQWSRYIRNTLVNGNGPVYVALWGTEEFLTLTRDNTEAICRKEHELEELRKSLTFLNWAREEEETDTGQQKLEYQSEELLERIQECRDALELLKNA